MIQNKPKELSYYYHSYDIVNWLHTDPLEEEITYDDKGKKSQKFSVIKRKLDYLCPDNWDTKNFHHFFIRMPDNRIKISGNIDVVIRYHYELQDGSAVREVYRTLAGAATFYADEYAPNEHWGATVKSLCIVNALQVLGKQFGWELNPEEEEPDLFSSAIPGAAKQSSFMKNGKPRAKLVPPPDIRKQYARAAATNDHKIIETLEAIYDFTIK